MGELSRFVPRPQRAAMTAAALMAACFDGQGEPPATADPAEPVATIVQSLVTEDGLADAYAFFLQKFALFGQQYRIGAGFHPGLSTEVVKANGLFASAKIILDFEQGRVRATLDSIPMNRDFDLWFVKNVAGAGRTVKPETGDQFLKVGTFDIVNVTNQDKSLDVAADVSFDLDLVVVTRKDQHPTVSRVLVGSRTLFEKRFFRERNGRSLDPVTGARSNAVETNDPLVQRGAQLFFNETFAGNGRTCGTCHRAENNLTLDAKFIAALPPNDPLFVFETNPALAKLEDGRLLRERGLVLENVDGFEDPTRKRTERAVNHTFALGTTLDQVNQGFFGYPSAPPEHRLGWGGDGAPGRGTLNEFAFGAIVQHFTKRLDRVPGVDFRIPTQEELDAMEAFQLFTGRQKIPDTTVLVFRDTIARQGMALAQPNGRGKCARCHFELQPGSLELNENFHIGTHERTPDLPPDDGFRQPLQSPIPQFIPSTGTPGANLFNVAPLIEAADTAPFFHNNVAATIEDAVAHYTTPFFNSSGGGAIVDGIALTPDEIGQVAAFLRELNAAENLRQIRKRVTFVRNNRSTGNTEILRLAIRDCQDALADLAERALNPAAQHDIATAQQTLVIAQANADANRPAFMDHALVYIDLARGEILSANPNNDF
jgi:hypothetical protein